MRNIFLIFSVLALSFSATAQQVKPKNIIVFIADGGGYNQMMCTDYYLYGKYPASPLSKFPVQLSMSTYNGSLVRYGATCYDSRAFWTNFNYAMAGFTESAASGTALGTGVKTHNDQIGLDLNGQPISNLVQVARAKGKKTGLVTTVPFSHATPAGFGAHTLTRRDMTIIARQMLFSGELDVLAGAGNPWFDNAGNRIQKGVFKSIDSVSYQYLLHNRTSQWFFTESRDEIQKIATGASSPKKFFYLAPVAQTLSQMRPDSSVAPFDIPINSSLSTLAEMSIAAVNVLDNDTSGFFLMVEGGAIDWANHENELPRLIEEYAGFYNAIDSVIEFLAKTGQLNQTLIVVTSDHECGYLWGPELDGNKFTEPVNNGKGKMPSAVYYSDNHSNALIPFFAMGPSSEIFYSYADETDSARGAYLTNSEVAQSVKMLWGNTAYVFEADPLNNESPVLSIALPCQQAKVQWYANGKAIEGETNMQFLVRTIVYSPETQFKCEVTCGSTIFVSPNYSYRYE